MGELINSELRKQLELERAGTKTPDEMLAEIRDVGSGKPMGYVLLSKITGVCNTTPDILIEEAQQKGLKTDVIELRPEIPALFVWDEEVLQELLDAHKIVLEDADWPTNAQGFVERVVVEYAPERTKLFDLIADAYGDYRSPLRLYLGESPSLTPETSFADQYPKRDPLAPDGSGWAKDK